MKAKNIFCTVLLAIAVIFKFWLIAEMEITDDPNDPHYYVAQILADQIGYYGPGTEEVGRLFYHLGIPFRLGIETIYLFSCLLVIKALFAWPTRSFLSLGLYLFVIFNPNPEELLSHFMSDQVWLVEMLMGISLFIFFARDPTKIRWLYVTLAGLCFAFSSITRSTLMPLIAALLVWAVVSGALWFLKNRRGSPRFPAVGGLLVCLYAIGLVYFSTCYSNSKIYGYYGLSIFDCREYQDFYMCMQSVGDPTGDRYCPIDDNRLKLIEQAGPESHWMVQRLRMDTYFKQASLEAYGKPGVALTWFHWRVYETLGWVRSFTQIKEVFKNVEAEIAQAGREKRLKVRPIIPLPDCRIRIVLSATPDALRHVAHLTVFEPPRYAWCWGFGEPKFEDQDFSKALNRQKVTPSPTRDRIGQALCTVYSPVYRYLLLGLVVALGAFAASLVYRWKIIPALSSYFLAQQLFAVSFVILFGWYVLFDASGLIATPRYLVFNNVMLPILLVYYARKTGQLLAAKAGGVEGGE